MRQTWLCRSAVAATCLGIVLSSSPAQAQYPIETIEGPWVCPSQLVALTNYSASYTYPSGQTVSYQFYFGIGSFVASQFPLVSAGRYNFGTLTSNTSSLVKLANAHILAHCINVAAVAELPRDGDTHHRRWRRR